VKGTTQFLPYTIGAHPDLDGTMCTAAKGCHRYFRETAARFNDQGMDIPFCKGHRGGRRAAGSSSAGASALEAAVAAAAESKKGEQCKHFAVGKCRMPAGKCKYDHTGEAARIPCGLPVRKDGKCLLGDRCPYLHASEETMVEDCKYYASTKPP
jgi:hypothetical protein